MSKKAKEKQKGKGKGAKGRATITNVADKLTNADRAFYELTIQDARKKILTLRAHLQNILVTNDNIVEEIRQKTEGKVNKSTAIQRNIDEIEEHLSELKILNAKLTQNYNEEKRKTNETIEDLESRNKAMQYQLTAEIKRLNGRLNACQEFRENEDEWMIKYSEITSGLIDNERENDEAIMEIQAKLDYENNRLKEELLNKIALAGEEFSGSTANTQGIDFNMRLIRENIALQKNIEVLTNNTAEMKIHIEEEKQLYKTNKMKIPELEKRNSELVLQCQEKLDLIKIQTAMVEALKSEYIASLCYQKQNINFIEFQICAQFRRNSLQQKLKSVSLKMNAMDSEMNMYDFLIEQYKKETQKIENYLENFSSTIERSLCLKDPPPTTATTTPEQMELLRRERNNFLAILVGWLEQDFDTLDVNKRASIASVAGSEQYAHFDSLFKKEAPSLSSLMGIWLNFVKGEDDDDDVHIEKASSSTAMFIGASSRSPSSTIIPTERPFIQNAIVDVESGTSLYFSSPREDEIVEEAGDIAPEEEEEQSSSEGSYEASVDSKARDGSQPQDGKVDSENATNKMPSGTIVDVVSEEESEGQIQAYEYAEEDEEYDMNWFY